MKNYKKIISAMACIGLLLGNIPASLASNYVKPTADEVKKVETQIVSLQSNLFDSSKNVFEKLSGEFQKLASYEEKGNISIDMSMDEAVFGKGNASFTMDNYSAKAALFNSEISGNINFSADYSPVYGSGFEIDISTFASMISKDSEIYVLLKDFDFKINNENVAQVLTQVKEQFKENKYIKLPTDEQSKATLELLQNLQSQSFLSQVDKTLQSPFFTPYKKVGDKYFLVPTKYACDKYFELDNKLNASKYWFEPQSCSETIYKKVVNDFVKEGELYIVLGEKENTLGYYFVDSYDKTVFDLQVKYTDTSINSLDLGVMPDQTKYKNEGWTLNYAKNEFLKSNLYAEKGAYKMNFYSELNPNNHFTQIDASFNFNKEFVGNFTLKDKKMNGFFLGKQKGYDYNSDNWEYTLQNVFAAKITGSVDDENILKNFVVKIAGVDVKTKKAFLLGKFGYNTGSFTTYLKYEDALGKIVLNGKGQVENKYFSYDGSLDFNNTYKAEMSGKIDTRDNKNNANISLIVNNAAKKVASFSITSQATREYKSDINIESPKDFRDYVVPSVNFGDEYSNYDEDYDYDEEYLDSFEEIE